MTCEVANTPPSAARWSKSYSHLMIAGTTFWSDPCSLNVGFAVDVTGEDERSVDALFLSSESGDRSRVPGGQLLSFAEPSRPWCQVHSHTYVIAHPEIYTLQPETTRNQERIEIIPTRIRLRPPPAEETSRARCTASVLVA